MSNEEIQSPKVMGWASISLRGVFPQKPGHDASSGTLSFHSCVKVHLWGKHKTLHCLAMWVAMLLVGKAQTVVVDVIVFVVLELVCN